VKTAPNFAREQRAVAIRMALAVLLSAVAVGVAVFLCWKGAPESFEARLTSALVCDLAVVAWLAACIANVARLRFLSATDIAGSAGATATERVRFAGAILQNTLEQVALAVPVHLALACALPRASESLVVLAALFCLGRVLFWRGYTAGAGGRALGFALTFYPTVMALAVAAAATALR
jgi:hypothetical protein